VLVTGYSQSSIEALADGALSIRLLEAHGARNLTQAVYRTEYTLTARDLEA